MLYIGMHCRSCVVNCATQVLDMADRVALIATGSKRLRQGFEKLVLLALLPPQQPCCYALAVRLQCEGMHEQTITGFGAGLWADVCLMLGAWAAMRSDCSAGMAQGFVLC